VLRDGWLDTHSSIFGSGTTTFPLGGGRRPTTPQLPRFFCHFLLVFYNLFRDIIDNVDFVRESMKNQLIEKWLKYLLELFSLGWKSTKLHQQKIENISNGTSREWRQGITPILKLVSVYEMRIVKCLKCQKSFLHDHNLPFIVLMQPFPCHDPSSTCN
jgi:hypothetical protein